MGYRCRFVCGYHSTGALHVLYSSSCHHSPPLSSLAPIKMKKKRSEETQTLRAGCSRAEPKSFAPSQTPFPGAREGQNLISWRWSLHLPTNPVWWGSMHTISSYRGNIPTNTHKQIHRQDRLQYTVPQLSAQCNQNGDILVPTFPVWPGK